MSEPVRKSVHVRCSPDRAFELFTRQIDAWWPRTHRRSSTSELKLQPRAGGRIYECDSDGRELPLGEVRTWQPPHRLVYTWLPGAIDRPTCVEVRFTAHGGHTRVDVVHAEADSALGQGWPARAEKFTWAWGEVLPAFARFVENRSTEESLR